MGTGGELGVMRGLCSMGGLQQALVIPTTPITSTTWTAAADATTATPNFGTLNIGAAASNRYIIAVCINYGGLATMDTLSIGGTAATLLYTTGTKTTVWGRLVTSGTSATFTGTNAQANSNFLSVWRVISTQMPVVDVYGGDKDQGGAAVDYAPMSVTITTQTTNSPIIAHEYTGPTFSGGVNNNVRNSGALKTTTTIGSNTISTANSAANVTWTGATESFDLLAFSGRAAVDTMLEVFALA